MLFVAQKRSDKGFYMCLNVISAANDAHANDVIYHNTYRVMLKEKMIKRELEYHEN